MAMATVRIGLRSVGAMSVSAASRARHPATFARVPWTAGQRFMSTMFAESHEYIKKDGDTATVGITQHAADALGDVVHVDLPDVGATVEAGESFGAVESVKAASDVYAPAAGEVVEINEALSENPGVLNSDPYGQGWFMKMKITGDMPDTLLDQAAYEEHCEKSK